MVRHWRAMIVGVAFVLSIVSVALEQVTRAFLDSAFAIAYLRFLGVPRSRVAPFDAGEWFLGVLLSPLLALVFNWPLLVLAARIERHITLACPNALFFVDFESLDSKQYHRSTRLFRAG